MRLLYHYLIPGLWLAWLAYWRISAADVKPTQRLESPGSRAAHLLPLLIAGIFWHTAFWVGVALFVVGWTLQFIGHAIEGKPPEFLKDWRFLLVGSRWWFAKMRGKA